MDVKNAFLQGDLEEWFYMIQPPDFQPEMNKLIVCRLKKSLYSLKQALRVWNANSTHQLRKMGFATSNSNSLLFIWNDLYGPVCVFLYIYDLVITRPGLNEIGYVKSQLSDAFEMKDLGTFIISLGSR